MTTAVGATRPGRVRADWERRLGGAPAHGVFGDVEIAGLPEPVRRHLRMAICPGSVLTRAVSLTMHGTIRIGRWLPFRAWQVLDPHVGYIWAARAAGLVVGSDTYLDGDGAMDWRLAGLVTVVHADGPDVSKARQVVPESKDCWFRARCFRDSV